MQSPIDPAYHHPIFKAQYVVASISTLGYWTPMRMAGAQARRVLVDAAAQKWGVPAAECVTEPSMVVHQPSGRKMSYGEIASFATPPATPPAIDATKDLKKPGEYRLLGKGVPRVDVPAKTDGIGALRHRRARARHGVRHVRAPAGARQRPGVVQRRRGEEAARHRRRGHARPRRRRASARPSPP